MKMPKYYRKYSYASARARAMRLAAIQSRALMPATEFQLAQAAQLRRRALLRRAFNRWRVVRGQRSRLPNLRRNYIVNLAMRRAMRR